MFVHNFRSGIDKKVVDAFLKKLWSSSVTDDDALHFLGEVLSGYETFGLKDSEREMVEKAERYFAITLSSSHGNKAVILYDEVAADFPEAHTRFCEHYSVSPEVFGEIDYTEFDYMDGKKFYIFDLPIWNSRDKIFAE